MPPPDENGDPKAVVVFTRDGRSEFVLAKWRLTNKEIVKI